MPSKQNILYISESAQLGGAEISLLELIENLDKERFKPFVICSKAGPLIERLKQLQIPVYLIPLHKVRQICFWKFLKSVVELTQFLKKNDISLLHSNSTRSNFLGALAAKITRLPVIWHVRNLAIPGIYTDLEKYFSWLPEAIITNSKATAERFSQASRKVFVIYNGVDLEKLNPQLKADKVRCELNISAEAKIVAVVGWLEPRKGQDLFLQAISLLKGKAQKVKFLIVGSSFSKQDAAIEEGLKAKALALGIERDVIFTGFRQDIPLVMAALDILVCPSLIIGEAFGRVLVEAMATAVPVIATDAGGPREIVEKDVTGILVPMKDATSLAQAIKFLLDNGPLAHQMGQAGRKRAEQLFNVKETTKQVEEIYLTLLQRR